MHVLFLGNGFDLYHELKTSYKDFLKIIQNLSAFKLDADYYLEKKGDGNQEHIFKDYFDDVNGMSSEDVHKIYTLLWGNVWAIYYGRYNANIQGWIDFENEMNPLIALFRNVFSKGVGISNKDKYLSNPTYLASSYKEVSIANILIGIFFEDDGEAVFRVSEEFFDRKYGLLKDKILDKLEKDLEKFTLAFTIYLREFVELKSISEYQWIKKLHPNRIISFNYTKTERFYFDKIPVDNISHLHGTTDFNNIVFGTDLINDDDKDFMHFCKRYQRITKVSDYSYIDYLKGPFDYSDLFKYEDDKNNAVAFKVSFIGCSLDKNDSPIFKKYIKRAETINIYCYGFDDYKKNVANLINIFGSKMIAGLQREKKITFFDIKGVEFDGEPKVIEPRIHYRKSLLNKTDEKN